MANIYSGPLSPDRFQTTTSYGGLGSIGIPGVGGFGLPDMSGLIKRRMEQEDADRKERARLQRAAEIRQANADQERAAMRGAGGPTLRMTHAERGSRPGVGAINPMNYAPPMRVVSGPGIIPGYAMDVNAMTGAQRQAYLPQASSGQFQTGLQGAAQAQELQNQFNQMRLQMAKKQVEREGGF